ncbi:MAG: hypothetical protein ACRCWI_05885, partial [Brevinema sp.]
MENSGRNEARQCFYQGQSVAPEHLNKLQDFTMQGQANLVASLLGYGIVNGFGIETVEGHIIGVSARLAFNLQGERLILAGGKQVNLVGYKPNTGDKTIKLGIILSYEKTESSTDIMGNTVYTKWTPTVEFVTKETLEANEFELATIKLNPTSITEIITTAPNFGTLPKVTQDLLSQIHNLSDKTSALTTLENSTTINSPLLNLITNNLQINGTPYMEIGSNNNGHYVKFENGLLICICHSTWKAPTPETTYSGHDFTFPFAFKNPPIYINGSIHIRDLPLYFHTQPGSSLYFNNIRYNGG